MRRKFFMVGSKIEEKKYFQHNQDRYNFIFRELGKISKGKKVLDIGTSPFTFLLKEKYPEIDLFSLDYSAGFGKRCREKSIAFIHQDLNKKIKPQLKNKFDLVIFLEVMEHLKKDGKDIIQDLLFMTKKGGYIFIQTPNKYALKNVILKIITTDVWNNNLSKPPKVTDEFHHFREFGFEELKNLLNNFKNIKVVKAERPLYFDVVRSSIVYRKYKMAFLPVLYMYYLVVNLITFFRMGMYFKLQKR